ncbi:hypothetical protein PENTCL1PPCAC_14307, partial [Pristionchus entomophagus]
PRWRNIFKSNATFWWRFLSGISQLLYVFGYLGAIRLTFMPTAYKTAHYCQPLLDHNGIDIRRIESGYVACIFRMPSYDPSLPDVWQTDALISISIALALLFPCNHRHLQLTDSPKAENSQID